MKQQHYSGEQIVSRYQIVKCLGRGGMGITYQAQDLHNNQQVALKCLSLKRVNDWKSLELFEREAQVLATLEHPAIPNYLNYFQTETEQEKAFYLAQELAPGQSLFELLEQGWRPEPAEVMDIAIQILEILVYLQDLIPPVIHRDIKPQNILRDQLGRVTLVDFGAVRDTYHQSITGGSTIVGTFGYMAPEQFRGQAVLSTDLYGLGATLLFLLTGKSPAELPQRRFTINFRAVIQPPEPLSQWLDRALSPTIEGRFRSATEALAVLRGEEPMPPQVLPRLSSRPSFSSVRLTKRQQVLDISIPPTLLNNSLSLMFGLLPLFCSVLGLLTLHMLIVETLGSYPWFSLLVGLPFLIIFWKQVAHSLLFSGIFRTTLMISADRVKVIKKFWGLKIHQNFSMGTFALQSNLVKRSIPFTNMMQIFCRLSYSNKTIKFGSFLTPPEQAWLTDEIQSFLEAAYGGSNLVRTHGGVKRIPSPDLHKHGTAL